MLAPNSTTAVNPREVKGKRIAERHRLKSKGGLWLVPSESGEDPYWVDPEGGTCTCPDATMRLVRCKHQFAVEYTIQRETTVTETTTHVNGTATTTTVTETVKTTKRRTYRQNWPKYNLAAMTEKATFLRLMSELCAGIDEPAQAMGRPRLPIADVVFALALKVYSGMSGRRFMSDLSDAHAKGYLTRPPRHSSLFRYLEMPELTPLLRDLIRVSSLPLKAIESDFAVDSTGFGTSDKVSWFDKKHNRVIESAAWVKIHAMAGVLTHIVTAVEVSGQDDHDYPFLPGLVGTTARTFRLREISADKAYSGVSNLQAIADQGATPYVPFMSHTTGKGGSDLWRKMWAYYNFQRDEFLEHYHKRSNIETVNSMVKAKFGDTLTSKTDTGQRNEALLKMLCHNVVVVGQSIHELDLAPTFWTESADVQEVV